MKNTTIKASVWNGTEISANRYIILEKELIGYVISGEVYFSNENEDKTKNAKSNDIVIIERGLYYVESANWENVKIIVFGVQLSQFANGFYRINTEIIPQRLDTVIVQAADAEVTKYFNKIEKKMGDSEKVSINEQLFTELFKIIFSTPSSFASKALWFRKLDIALIAAIDYIYNNMSISFNLEEIARNSNATPSKLNRLFNKYVGMTPCNWSSFHKINYAKYHVHNSKMKISEISSIAGHTDTTNFIKKYRTQHGNSPQRDRKQKLNKEA